MGTSSPARLSFRRSAPAPVIGEVARLASAHRGWVNMAPDLDEGDPAGQRGGWFSARGPAAPRATYLAGRVRRGGRAEPDQIGIEHASGTKAARRLASAGHPVPDGWVVRQDHPRRGLVVELPAGTPADAVVSWLLDAAAALSQVELGDAWLAEVWEG